MCRTALITIFSLFYFYLSFWIRSPYARALTQARDLVVAIQRHQPKSMFFSTQVKLIYSK